MKIPNKNNRMFFWEILSWFFLIVRIAPIGFGNDIA